MISLIYTMMIKIISIQILASNLPYQHVTLLSYSPKRTNPIIHFGLYVIPFIVFYISFIVCSIPPNDYVIP